MKEALKLALEALTNAIAVRNGEGGTKLVSPLEENAITAIKEALAPTSIQCEVQPEQEPDMLTIAYMSGLYEGRKLEREACHALRQTLPNPYDHCQVSAHAHDMAVAAYGSAIRARGNT